MIRDLNYSCWQQALVADGLVWIAQIDRYTRLAFCSAWLSNRFDVHSAAGIACVDACIRQPSIRALMATAQGPLLYGDKTCRTCQCICAGHTPFFSMVRRCRIVKVFLEFGAYAARHYMQMSVRYGDDGNALCNNVVQLTGCQARHATEELLIRHCVRRHALCWPGYCLPR